MKSRKLVKSLIVIATITICLGLGLLINPVKVEAASKVKVTLEFTDGTKKTWQTGDKKIKLGKKKLSYVYFGSYPQTEVTGKKLTSSIKNAKYDENGVATVNGVKYKRLSWCDSGVTLFPGQFGDFYDWDSKYYAYFKFEPIKWRVLSNSKGTVLLLSEYGIDCQDYNDKLTDITWEECSLRNWLNKDFIATAFTKSEKKLIKTTKTKNEANPLYDTSGGKNTTDKIFILSLSEANDKKYGFNHNELNTTWRSFEEDDKKICMGTDYTYAMAYQGTDKGVMWWLRTPGIDGERAMYVSGNGAIGAVGQAVSDCEDYGEQTYACDRPVMKLNLSNIIA